MVKRKQLNMSIKEKVSKYNFSFDKKNYSALLVLSFGILMLTGYGISQSSGTPDVSIGSNGIQINSGTLDMGGGDITDGGTTIWDSSNGYIPKANIESLSASDVGLGNVENENALAEDGSEALTGNLDMSGNTIYDVDALSDGSSEISDGASFQVYANEDSGQPLSLQADGSVNVEPDKDASSFEWSFTTDKKLGLPDGGSIEHFTEDLELAVNTGGASNNAVVLRDYDGGTCNMTDGDFSCTGSKNWVHDLGNGEKATYTAQESPQVRAVYEGRALVEGSKNISLPSHFSKTVSDTEPMLRVQATPHELATVAVTERTDDYLVIESSKDVKVDYRVTGIREGYEDKKVVREK